MTDFTGFPKIARLFRKILITEKLNGTNAAVGIAEFQFGWHVGGVDPEGINHDIPFYATLVLGPDTGEDGLPDKEYLVYAQSRTRIISEHDDNYGFAKWVKSNAKTLVTDLGPGLHFGEWWGSGIQSGYGLKEKRFSLFNTTRWADIPDHIHDDDGTVEECPGCFGEPLCLSFKTPGLGVVPVLYKGPFSTEQIQIVMDSLRNKGSVASPGFMKPEGIVIYHTAGNVMFKATLEKDEQPKGK